MSELPIDQPPDLVLISQPVDQVQENNFITAFANFSEGGIIKFLTASNTLPEGGNNAVVDFGVLDG